MDQRMKIWIALLLTAVFCLSAAAAAYTMQTRAEQSSVQPETESETPHLPDPGGLELYVENGLWGARTPGGRVLAEPQWYYLRIMNDDVLIAKRQAAEGTRSGLIRTNGELLVPFLYRSIEPVNENLWVAELDEGGQTAYHLYRGDGTRWTDVAWESCETDSEGNAVLSAGRRALTVRFRDGKTERTSWHSLHAVGLHDLRLDFDTVQLAALPDSETLLRLGDAAAAFLTYLFIDDKQIDASLFSGEDPDALNAAPRYQRCFLQKASVSRVRLQETAGFPTYLMQIQVSYSYEGGAEKQQVDTAMDLTVSRNAAGGYTYSGFSDVLSEMIR